MTTEHLAFGSRFAVHSHALAGTVTVATWFILCTGFGLEVAPARDPVARLYRWKPREMPSPGRRPWPTPQWPGRRA
jgi:hypothetical protein